VRLLNRPFGRLSRHRRGPLAGLLVVLMGLLLTGGLYAAFSPAQAHDDDSAAQIKQGRELYLVGCSFCHGSNGQGVETLDGKQLGPSLVGVGAAAVDFQVGTGRMPAAQPGAQIPQKETAYTPEEIAALAAYVASLGPGPAIPPESDYNIDNMTPEEREAAIARGGQIFLTNCTACHNFEGSGGAMPRGGYAPKIRGVHAKYIFEAMLTGPQAMDNFSNGNLSVEEKRDIIAYLQSIEDAPNYGGFSLGGIGPVSEGLFAWLVGIGSLVGVAIWIAAHTARTSKQKPEADQHQQEVDKQKEEVDS
jgi:ubiquinol-cytochrome c reductase cytochrome c subunit